MYQERFLITGGSGFIGTSLVQQLLLEGHEVTVLTRDVVKTANHFSNIMAGSVNQVRTIDDLTRLNPDISFDVIINLAGQGIADKRWTPQVKQQLQESRIKTTKALCQYVKEALIKPDVFISGSALGYYGVGVGDEKIDETGQPDQSFSSQLCLNWEKEASCIERLGVRTCYLRTGIVLGNNGGALAKMLPAFKWGLGGQMGSGRQWMPWIHRQDLIGIIRFLVENERLSGVFNGVSPNPVRNKEFATVLGRALKRPSFLPMPAFVLRIMLGEMANELLLSGKRVMPSRVLDAGYIFQFPVLKKALADVLLKRK